MSQEYVGAHRREMDRVRHLIVEERAKAVCENVQLADVFAAAWRKRRREVMTELHEQYGWSDTELAEFFGFESRQHAWQIRTGYRG